MSGPDLFDELAELEAAAEAQHAGRWLEPPRRDGLASMWHCCGWLMGSKALEYHLAGRPRMSHLSQRYRDLVGGQA